MSELPDNFKSTVCDLLNDLDNTYPEYKDKWSAWVGCDDSELKELHDYMVTVFPERFFDILYQNADIFNKDDTTNVMFLPDVDFRLLFNCEGISDNTKKTLWKYLQLLLFVTVGSIDDKSKFGDTANIFEGMGDDMLQEKLKETMEGLTSFFNDTDVGQCDVSGEEIHFDASDNTMPDVEGIHEHLKGIFDGKIGKLAKELAEEISVDFEDMMKSDKKNASQQDIMKKLMKNPKQMMDMVKKVSGKLQSKMDSGEISKDELMEEAGTILNKMKEMGGSKEVNDMFKKFAGGMGLGKNAKLDINALKRMTTQESTRDRLRKKAEEKKTSNLKRDPVTGKLVFSTTDGIKQERSSVEQARIEDELIASFGEMDKKQSEKKGKGKGKKKGKGKGKGKK
jgi:hypothetical protein